MLRWENQLALEGRGNRKSQYPLGCKVLRKIHIQRIYLLGASVANE